ncbi:MAG: GNAT family N-acetyltransferase [Parvibaculum sp.]
MSVIIRRAEPEDFPKLGAIEISAGELFREHGLADVADNPPTDIPFFLSCARFGAVLVAEIEGTLAGFALAAKYDGTAHLYEVSVSRDHQGHGVGRKLIEGVCDWAKGEGFKSITLSTFSDLPWNAPFYTKLGFSIIGSGDYSPAMMMLRGREEHNGLDMSRRCLMRKELAR